MKTTVIAIEDRTANADLLTERKAIKLINSCAVYVDELSVVDVENAAAFECALCVSGDVTVIVNAELSRFDYSKILSDIGIKIDEDGFFVKDKLVALYSDKQDFSQKFLDKLSGFYGFTAGKNTFKLFGVDHNDVKKETDGISAECPAVFFNVVTNALDTKVDLFYSEKSPKMQVDKAVKLFLTKFNKSVYAEDEVTLEQRFKDLLKLHRLTCSTAESMTGGAIAARIVTVDGASDVFYEGMVTYNTLAKERRLNVSHKTVVDYTVVSSQVAYEMAADLLANVDVAISVTGYAGSTDHPAKDDGLCYIGIGVKDKIEVYNFRFKGTRTENIASATNAALFLAIKTVANTDF